MEEGRAGKKIVGFFFIALLGSLITLSAQYKVSGEIIDVDNGYHDVLIAQKSEGIQQKVVVNLSGKFTTQLDWNKVYHLSFRKPGYVTKVIEFSTVVPINVNRQGIQPYELHIRLFKVFDGVDTVFFKNPIAKIRYELDVNDFAADKDYSLNVKYHLEQMRKGVVSEKELVTKQKQNKKNKQNSVNQSSVIQPKEIKSTQKNFVVINSPEISVTNDALMDTEIIDSGIPHLKTNYPIGRTDEHFELKGRVVKRTIINEGAVRRVYFSVKHDWGGEYFFIDEAEIGYRCISKKVYHAAIDRMVTAKRYK